MSDWGRIQKVGRHVGKRQATGLLLFIRELKANEKELLEDLDWRSRLGASLLGGGWLGRN